ncbi:MAG: DUF835 domain-containing protein [Theionarchaea archaeon]|nr:DUF835 domain-containing protein [Theionarchaea archaeon]MBU7000576.1 DUF835 domain-containing protein [Theionarchaea archaeon]MBU7020478.1 DUF835 domain-containing protein [Theionarchaea archaeon]MBU7034480.1 DUF835 domain-containing protein [Theionarchaea archaeon]MBU7039771.1 DUF835 domain-containing protein [Theionarchaea archaeon]
MVLVLQAETKVVSQTVVHYSGLHAAVLVLLVLAAFRITKLFTPPEEVPTEKPQLEKGTMYLVKGRDVERSYSLFADWFGKNATGLIITRKNPPRVKTVYNLSAAPALWLSQKDDENVLYPTQLHKLSYIISEAVFDQKDPVILLDGLEYLIVHNKFEPVLKQLYIIREVLSRHGGIMLIPVDPEAFSEKEMGFLEKESVSI